MGRLNSGSNGCITNYVTQKYEVDLVMNIEKSVRLNQELNNVNANVKRFYKKFHDKNEMPVEETNSIDKKLTKKKYFSDAKNYDLKKESVN